MLHGGLVGSPAFVMPALAGGQQEDTMLKKILEALGLAADATEEQAAEAVAALKSERDEARAAAAASAPSLDEFVPRADYDAAVARAAAAEEKAGTQADASRDAEIRDLLDRAQAAGQITPATRVLARGAVPRGRRHREVQEVPRQGPGDRGRLRRSRVPAGRRRLRGERRREARGQAVRPQARVRAQARLAPARR